jgi:ABC-type multidrug transport system ATPase subunit
MEVKGMSDFAITTWNLIRRFGDLTAVDALGLQVPRGSVYGFLGPNGAGKTTTIRMLLGLIRPHDGEVRLFDEVLFQNRMALLRRVGALVESPSLYPNLTGRENLEVTRRLIGARNEQVNRGLRIVRLEEAADRRVQHYSTGMRQRLGLALALLAEPELLILDEPTNGLDPAGIHEMRDLVVRLPREHGITVFLSSHLLNEVEQVATHIGIIHKGRMLFQGTRDGLQSQLGEHVSLGVNQPEEAQRLLSQEGWTVKDDGDGRLLVTVSGRSEASKINAQLVRGGVSVFHLSLERLSLEKVFLRLTEGETTGGGAE